MKTTTKAKRDSNGRPFTTGRDGSVLRGGLTCGEMHLLLVALRTTGGMDLVELKAQTGLEGRKVSKALRYLETTGQAWFDYATNTYRAEVAAA
jgi:hypothetical protein